MLTDNGNYVTINHKKHNTQEKMLKKFLLINYLIIGILGVLEIAFGKQYEDECIVHLSPSMWLIICGSIHVAFSFLEILLYFLTIPNYGIFIWQMLRLIHIVFQAMWCAFGIETIWSYNADCHYTTYYTFLRAISILDSISIVFAIIPFSLVLFQQNQELY
jgi:hypothetical protein